MALAVQMNSSMENSENKFGVLNSQNMCNTEVD